MACCFRMQAQYNTSSANSIRFQNKSYGFVTTLAPPPPTTEGKIYLYDEPLVGDIYFRDSTALTGLTVMLNIKDKLVEIQHGGAIKVLPFDQVLLLRFDKKAGRRDLYNSAIFGKHVPIVCLVDVLAEGRATLVQSYETEVVRASYNAALDVGSRNERVVEKKNYYLITKNEFVPVTGNGREFKKRILQIFGVGAKDMVEAVNMKKEDDLIQLIQSLNAL
jgi:hypothetical protein